MIRYNGKSHEHTNLIEGNSFFDFHIHTATERYQQFGTKPDAYAEPTDLFYDLSSAIKCLFQNCNFKKPSMDQIQLFNDY